MFKDQIQILENELFSILELYLKECKNLEMFKRHCSIYLLNKQETELL
jgi:hypothetical protein